MFFMGKPSLVLFILLYFQTIRGWSVEPIRPEMIVIPGGPFIYGTDRLKHPNMFIHRFEPAQQTIDCPTFAIGKYEVTESEFTRFILDGGYEQDQWWSKEGLKFLPHYMTYLNKFFNKNQSIQSYAKTQLPITGISWYEAEAYCNWLSAKLSVRYRLPTEIEWEKAARGTDGRIWPWGSDWDPTRCNWMDRQDHGSVSDGSYDGFSRPAPVGSFPQGASPYGCLDMAGNLKEWCQDWFDPANPFHKVLRGGSYYTAKPWNLRCARRGGLLPEQPFVNELDIGFRLAADDYNSFPSVQ